ncbi:MAG: hypothetical protein JWQ03_1345, partial [Variovorax sp.]|nr:hypothetical protein [Variovorax sp.]
MDETIRQLVATRRTALHGTDGGERPWGLALSGGGIRSATFCLGLLKALAAHRQLLRFDLLSTVSGGGYVGATLGRLCGGAASAEQVREIERAFGHVERVRFGGWLRGNGRYLIPGGLGDVLFAAALYLRNLLGTHIELAIAASLVGMVLAALNLLLWDGVFRAVDLDTATRDAVVDATALSAQEVMRLLVQEITRLPTLWFAAVGPLVASVALACAYWSVRDRPSSSAMLMQVGLWTALGTGACWIGPMLVARFSGPLWLTPVFVAFALCWVVALLWVLWRSRHRSATEMRNRLTDALASVLKTLLLIAMLGVLDRSAWWMAADSRGQRASYGAVLLVLAAMLRAVLPTLLAQKHERPGIGKALLLTLASLLGLALAFCLAAWWMGVVYAAVLLPVFTPAGLDFSRGWVWLGTLFVIVGSYALVTGGNLAFLNLSSLHMFYRARIVRGYLGAANAGRLGGAPTDEVSGLALPQVPVGEVDAGDDISQLRYAPHARGGPVHLINACINQTHDTRQRLFNRDRKGLPFTVGPLGWMQAGNADWARVHGDSVLTLGAWTAISGAAVASGLGRMTHRGLAALSVFAGLRLGYWWNSAEAGLLQRGAAARGSTLLMKTRFLLMECFGTFPGSSSAHWYLSDGGHFENTGAYALLRQQAALIVIADCGADPDYRFCDLENLIRRARIDLNAEITFMKPYPGADWPPLDAFGSLNDLASITSQACLALAQVRYADGATGQIVLVKPNVSASLPVDLVNFKAANPLFPQQPTTDQFFDEAQWESYFQLGAEIGSRLDGELLDRVALGTIGLFVPDDGQPQSARPAGPVAGAGNDPAAPAIPATTATATAIGTMSRLQARVLRAGAVTASVGLGTAATFGVAAWQGIDSWRVQRAETERAENVAFKDLTERWARLRGGAVPGEASALLAADLLRTGDLLCREGSDNFMTKFRLSVRIVDDARQACAQGAVEQRAPACARLLDTGNGIDCLQPAQAPPCAPRYWGRDYSGQTAPQHNCSGTVPEPWPVVTWLRGLGRREGDLRMAAVAPSPPAMTPVPGPVTAPAPGTGDVCKGTVVYIQTYGGALGAKARAWRGPWQALGATVPPIEDVL